MLDLDPDQLRLAAQDLRAEASAGGTDEAIAAKLRDHADAFDAEAGRITAARDARILEANRRLDAADRSERAQAIRQASIAVRRRQVEDTARRWAEREDAADAGPDRADADVAEA